MLFESVALLIKVQLLPPSILKYQLPLLLSALSKARPVVPVKSGSVTFCGPLPLPARLSRVLMSVPVAPLGGPASSLMATRLGATGVSTGAVLAVDASGQSKVRALSALLSPARSPSHAMTIWPRELMATAGCD